MVALPIDALAKGSGDRSARAPIVARSSTRDVNRRRHYSAACREIAIFERMARKAPAFSGFRNSGMS